MTIILYLEVKVDPCSVPSFHYHEVLNFFVSEMRSHCDNAGRVLDQINEKSDHLKVICIRF